MAKNRHNETAYLNAAREAVRTLDALLRADRREQTPDAGWSPLPAVKKNSPETASD
jgi:hypothetical protein